jgi:hypothetical protein
LGLLKRVESGIERVVGGVFGRSFRGHVDPGELAVKLVKEMEDQKRTSFSRAYLPNKFVVYLRADDRAHFRHYERSLAEELADHVTQHCRATSCHMVGPARVSFETDDRLKRGQFGISAEPQESSEGDGEDLRVRPQEAPPIAWEPSPDEHEPPPVGSPPVPAFVPPAGPPAPTGPSPSPRRPPQAAPATAGDTQSIPREVAAEMGLARQTVVLVEGSRRREFEQGRVVLGRGRKVDYQLDDPNVSRRHAIIYFEGGRLFLKDLGSTNGTLLNGKPVTSGPLAPGDVITLGGSDIRVETG